MKPDRLPDPDTLRFVLSDNSPFVVYIADGEEVVGSCVDHIPPNHPGYMAVSMYGELYTVKIPPVDELEMGVGMLRTRYHIGHAIVEAIARRHLDIADVPLTPDEPSEYWFIRTFDDHGGKSLTYADTHMYEHREDAVLCWNQNDPRQLLMRTQRGDVCDPEDVAHVAPEHRHRVYVVG